MLAVFLDIEATGLDSTKHVPIDIAFQVIDVTTGKLQGSYESVIAPSKEAWDKHDPISIQINGYFWEDVCTGKSPSTITKEIITLLQKLGFQRGKGVFICQNPAFDRSFFAQLVDVYTQERLNWPYHWLDLASMYWTMLFQDKCRQGLPFPEALNLSKNEIARDYGLPPEAEPHRAMNGVKHLMLCYQAVLGVKFEQQ